MRIIFIFIDGIGLGPENKHNPFVFSGTPFLFRLLNGSYLTEQALNKSFQGGILLGLDATLGVAGKPQSATGQASLFSGVNAPALIGRHLNGYPNRKLRDLLRSKGMFLQLSQKGLSGTFANAYRPEFFSDLKEGLQRYFSCSTLITYYACLPFRNLDDLEKGRAVYMDITNNYLQKLGFDIPQVTPEEAGRRLVEIASGYDLTLYEHFITDLVGHSQDREKAVETLNILDRFLEAVIRHMNPEEDLLLLTSDHGNVENLGIKGHTISPVPALIVGHRYAQLARSLEKSGAITGVLPAVLEVLSPVSTQRLL